MEEQTQKKTECSARHSTIESQIAQFNIEIDKSLDCLNKLREDIHKLASQISNNEQTITFKKEQQAESKEDIESASVEITCMTEEVEGLLLQIEDQRK